MSVQGHTRVGLSRCCVNGSGCDGARAHHGRGRNVSFDSRLVDSLALPKFKNIAVIFGTGFEVGGNNGISNTSFEIETPHSRVPSG